MSIFREAEGPLELPDDHPFDHIISFLKSWSLDNTKAINTLTSGESLTRVHLQYGLQKGYAAARSGYVNTHIVNETSVTDQVIPYVEPKDDKTNEFGSTLTSTLPMAAVSLCMKDLDK